MRRQAAPSATRLGRLMRELRPDGNPLRRATDRAEAAIMAGLLASFLAGAPLAGLVAGHWAHITGMRAERHQAATFRHVPAVLLQDSPPPVYSHGQAGLSEVRARWVAPDGSPRTGEVHAGGARAGSVVMVWIDSSGRVTGAPLRHSDADGQAALAAAVAPAALALTLMIAAALARWALGRRRLAAWEAAWLAIGPRWTGRR